MKNSIEKSIDLLEIDRVRSISNRIILNYFYVSTNVLHSQSFWCMQGLFMSLVFLTWFFPQKQPVMQGNIQNDLFFEAHERGQAEPHVW